MKKTEIISKIGEGFGKLGFKLKKHSPEILITVGIIGTVASAVMACRATMKVEKITDEVKEKMSKVHEAAEKGCTAMGIDYSAEDAKKDTVIVYAQTGLKLVKLYAPAVAVGVLSLTSVLASNNILRKRNVALAAAYATVDKSFKEYRKRVVEKFGKETDLSLRHNIKADVISEKCVDVDTGEEIINEDPISVVKPSEISGYARLFEKYTVDEDGNEVLNPHWDPSREYNLMHISSQENYANDLLKAHKRLFLNDVYKMLGFPPTKAGQVVGWVYDEEHPIGDNYVDFGPYKDYLLNSDDCDNPAILLDFNVDGNIWELM